MSTATLEQHTTTQWVKPSVAARAADLTPWYVQRMIQRRAIRVRRLPGADPLVNLNEVLELVQNSTIPAQNAG